MIELTSFAHLHTLSVNIIVFWFFSSVNYYDDMMIFAMQCVYYGEKKNTSSSNNKSKWRESWIAYMNLCVCVCLSAIWKLAFIDKLIHSLSRSSSPFNTIQHNLEKKTNFNSLYIHIHTHTWYFLIWYSQFFSSPFRLLLQSSSIWNFNKTNKIRRKKHSHTYM